MNITLFAAAETVRELLEELDPTTGELPEGFEDARELVATKSRAVAAFILANEAEANMVEEHAKNLLDRVKAARKRSAWLKEYLATHMKVCGIHEIKADDGSFRANLALGRDESVDIFDHAQLPVDYCAEKVTVTPDKRLIAKALKDGYNVPGARLVHKDRLTIR